MEYTIEEVENEQQAKEFLMLPVTLYKNDKNWVRPLNNDINNVFDPDKNPYFKHGECTRWLLRDENGVCVGRVASFIDEHTCRMDSYAVGGMGFFECIDDRKAAFMLFDRCREWLEARGMEAMEGPVNFGERNEWWGLLVDGFVQPNYGMPYTHKYYIKFFEEYGFLDYFKQYTYRTRLVMESLSKVVVWKSDRLLKNPDYSIVCYSQIDAREAKKAFLEVYNHAWNENVHGVGKMQMEQVEALFKTIKPILDPNLLYFAYYKGRPIGFFIMFPELNYIIKHLNGKLNGIGLLKFLYYRHIKKGNVALGQIFGVVSEFQGKGVEAALIRVFCSNIIERRKKYDWLEMNWIGDFNPQMIHLMEYIGAKISKTHITYRKLFREDIRFCRSIDKMKERSETNS
ncbi:hypothetical protein DMB45_12145 [Sanguibacteroides justesenii]|uniref:hypothetical protein n=1 Tax=Sanguibacteroides justesenii TaxID=1547597 RepID=UPI000D8FF2FB|nr:hypothetical protein [Sanguibacteroides justesenii]PXZ43134.1 hypothetical protein DMB45_12145 [Sanguibacteroides justesenii]